MANSKQQAKRVRTAARQRLENLRYKTQIKTLQRRLREAVDQAGASKSASAAMANLAEAIQGLVHHMRTEQQMIRDWVDSQADQQREIKKLLEVMVREHVNR